MKRISYTITLLFLCGTIVYTAVVLRGAREHHAAVLRGISEVQTQENMSTTGPLHFRVQHEQKAIEGRLNALFIVGITNILMVSACLAVAGKANKQIAEPSAPGDATGDDPELNVGRRS